MKKNDGSRRSFLKNILAGSAVAATAAVGAKKVKADEALAEKQTGDVLYRETEDFKKYYETLRS
ncbi:MAG: twin-arginine translocation signal domain-containing protein [Desulfobulbaceae bacterium]|nr:twin-arginine translocation signal domain-containing protein [Desulfobulbaceae bacterium]